MTENIERMKLSSQTDVASEHRSADEQCNRDWYSPKGCACVSCTAERDGVMSRAFKLLERGGYKVALTPAPRWTKRTGKKYAK